MFRGIIMLKYLLVFSIVLACGRKETTLSDRPETIVDSYSVKISNVPSKNNNDSALNLFEETSSISYLNIEGQLVLPNIPDEFNRDLGCLDVNLSDETYTEYGSSLVVSTTGLIGQTFPSVSIFIFMLGGDERVLLDPENPTTLASFTADSSHLFSMQICFELDYSEVPLQIYEGSINIQYLIESDELQISDCSLDSEPTACSQEEPFEIPQGQGEDAEAGETDGSTGDSSEDSETDGTDGSGTGEENSEDGTAETSDSGEGGIDDSSDAQSEGGEGQNDEPTEGDGSESGGGEDSGTSEDGDSENEQGSEPSGDSEDETSENPSDDVGYDPEGQCEAIVNMQSGELEPITKSGSYFLDANKFKITGNKTTAMFYLAGDAQVDAACLFLAGNNSNAQVIIDGSIGKLIIIERGNSASTTILVNVGANIGEIVTDFAGNNPQLSISGSGGYTCPNGVAAGALICE